LRQQNLELVELGCGRVFANEASDPLELGDERVENAITMMRRAEISGIR
jgi:hypothetical protein